MVGPCVFGNGFLVVREKGKVNCGRHGRWGRGSNVAMVSALDRNGERAWYCPTCWWMYRGHMPPELFEAKQERESDGSGERSDNGGS